MLVVHPVRALFDANDEGGGDRTAFCSKREKNVFLLIMGISRSQLSTDIFFDSYENATSVTLLQTRNHTLRKRGKYGIR